MKRLFNQLPGREAEVVRGCLEEVTRAAKRVKRCSKAAAERALGELRDRQRAIQHNTDCLPAIKIMTEDMAGRMHRLEDIFQAQHSPGPQRELCPSARPPRVSVTLNSLLQDVLLTP